MIHYDEKWFGAWWLGITKMCEDGLGRNYQYAYHKNYINKHDNFAIITGFALMAALNRVATE
jgi:hypothetical protein